MQTRSMAKRVLSRSTIGNRALTSAVMSSSAAHGPDLGADRPAVGIDDHAHDHLQQLGAMILGVATPTQGRAARAGEGQGRGVHEHQGQLGEQIAPLLDQMLLDQVLHTARRERRGPGLLRLSQLLAEPGHGAVEMVQGQAIAARDGIVGHPFLACPV
jgi:hypothetical protein